MAFKDLMVPKWKHSRIEVRIAAVNGLEDVVQLGEIAKTDESPLVRMAAIRKIDDEPLLTVIIESERDREVLDCAKKCLDALLKRIITTAQDFQIVCAALKKYDNEKVTAAYICEHTLDIETQRTLVEYIKSPHLLAKITENHCAVEIAERVVEQIADKELLQRIAQKASNKKIRTLAQNKIDVLFADPLAGQREITKKFELCCAGMDIPVTLQNFDQAGALLEVSQKLWNRYDPERQHPLAQQYAKAERILLDRIEQCNLQKAALLALETICLQMEDLITEPVETLEEKIERLQAAWAAVDSSLLPGLAVQNKHDRFKAATNALAARIDAAKQEQERLRRHQEAFEQCCNEFERFIANGNSTDEKKYRHAAATWDSLCAGGAPSESVRKRFADLDNEYRNKISAQAEAARVEQQNEVDYVQRLLADMESIAGAKPQQIGALHREAVQIKREWEKSYPLARPLKKELESAFAQAYAKFSDAYQEFKEQESWHQWANEHVKEKILAEIELVERRLTQGESFRHLSGRISLFTSQWRRAGGAITEKSGELDKKFSGVRERIFSLLLVKKTALLESLKTVLENESDRDCAEKIKTIQKQWNDIGYLPPELEKDLPETFYSLCNNFFAERKEQYHKYNETLQTNSAKREEICTEAEKIADSTDWKTAKETFLQLQQRWDESWPAPQKNMREQWQRFSKSRELFFERYDAFKAENDGRKEELCNNAERLLAQCDSTEPPVQPVPDVPAVSTDAGTVSTENQPIVNYDRILNEAITLQRSWKESGPASKARSEALWQRFNAAINKVFAIINDEHARNLLLREALVKEAEGLVASEEWDVTARKFSDIRLTWKTIGPAARRDMQALWNRLQAAGDAFFERRRTHFEVRKNSVRQQIDKKEALLAEMELLVRIAGKNTMHKASPTLSAAEILKKGIELRETLVVADDPHQTYDNIKKRAFKIIDIWESKEMINSDASHRLERRFDELLRVLKG